MIDGSHHKYEENIELTKKVVEYAHPRGVTVEAELGRLAGVEDDVNVTAEDASYTNPDQVVDFVTRTGCDSLAIAIGTSHGAFKFKPGQKPQLRFDILEEIERRLPGFPIVLHGASSVIPEFVDMINAYGGKMDHAIGIPEDMLNKVFFPFITTKQAKGGTGLGLSIVKNIMDMHQASIVLKNKTGGGGVIAALAFKV